MVLVRFFDYGMCDMSRLRRFVYLTVYYESDFTTYM